MSAKPDNIVAIATPQGRGGIGIVRISGPDLSWLTQSILGKLPSPRQASFSSFLDAQGQVIDQGVALFFPAPHSYTGENVLELQGHGGIAMPQLVLQRCLELGARLAQPGEFTQRAFLNNKLDLAQAESVADLIDASTSQAARCAMRSLQGEFSQAVHHLVGALIRLRMLVEAMLDFPEEEVDILDVEKRSESLDAIAHGLEQVLARAQQGSLLREGAYVVLVGQPNVGKSSLLNWLSGEEVALVSDVPGTTRDVIRQAIQLNGIPLHIVDTAGLREAQDKVEQMGIERTHHAVKKADAILLLADASGDASAQSDQQILAGLPPNIPRLKIFNKIDLTGQPAQVEEAGGECNIFLSAKTGSGVNLLCDKLLELIGWHEESGVFMARERHIRALLDARAHLQRAAGVTAQAEFMAEELRLAQEALNAITGEFTADDLLGEIFGGFCIGK
ncbi:MAG: tRNA uridine-5-carboxymethylaminomethyl(34) synthesis GTPase MnmE [Sideroxydans sp.]|nr:tRNA uridine-5-carboxymethylaminomethyl(34) synthesis GTPase MnmE [Sideroxydans sp.]